MHTSSPVRLSPVRSVWSGPKIYTTDSSIYGINSIDSKVMSICLYPCSSMMSMYIIWFVSILYLSILSIYDLSLYTVHIYTYCYVVSNTVWCFCLYFLWFPYPIMCNYYVTMSIYLNSHVAKLSCLQMFSNC